tara:strand:+ start:860 stop:1063 length:204 start_codon:yes stop_codon:yes gene_type:complete
MKYLFTQSEDNHIIIAEVPNTYRKENPSDYFLSKSCVDANVKSKNFTDVSDSIDYEGKVWMLTEDLA